jgi:TQXA domain-containing protein
MITERQRGRRRAAATIAAIAATACLVAGTATSAGAASTLEFHGSAADSGSPHGGAGDSAVRNWHGGLFNVKIDGVSSKAYCIDIFTGIDNEDQPTWTEVGWSGAGIANLETVEAILRHYYPNGNGPAGHELTGTADDKAMGTQAAIWHFTDGFELSTDPSEVDGGERANNAAVIANYNAILAAVEAGLEGFGEPTVTLGITPPASTEGEVGALVGPYVVDTTAASVTVTPSEGLTLVDSEGAPFTGEIVDGTELWLSADDAMSGTITATATAQATAGRVFAGVDSKGGAHQTLILATTVPIEDTAEAVVSFAETPPTVPPTTAPPTTAPETTTSAPTTTSTSVVPPSTTVPTTPSSGGGLPVTGAQSLILAAVALLLVGLGVGFRVVSRRAGSNG